MSIRIVSKVHYLPIEEEKSKPEEDLWIQKIARPIFAFLELIYQRTWNYLLSIKALCHKLFHSRPKEKESPSVAPCAPLEPAPQKKALVLEISLSERSKEMEERIQTPVAVEVDFREQAELAPANVDLALEEPGLSASPAPNEQAEAFHLANDDHYLELLELRKPLPPRIPLTPRRQAAIDELLWEESICSTYRFDLEAFNRRSIRRPMWASDDEGPTP